MQFYIISKIEQDFSNTSWIVQLFEKISFRIQILKLFLLNGQILNNTNLLENK